MRIGFITPEFVTEAYYSGGLANYIHRVSRTLTSSGHEVHIVTMADRARPPLKHCGAWVHSIPPSPWPARFDRFTLGKLPDTLRWLAFSRSACRTVNRLHESAPFDVLQLTNYRASGRFAALLSRLPAATRISSYQPIWNVACGMERTLDARICEWLEWVQLRLGSHVYAPSLLLKTTLERDAGLRDVHVIRSPVYLEATDRDTGPYDALLKGKKYLLFVGWLELHKGIHILAQALPRILAAHPDCHAAFAGLDRWTPLGPSMRDYTTRICDRAKDRLVFLGQTPHSQLYPIVAGARLVVLPSLVDNLPNAMLEAMALGTPVVGTTGASFDEVIEDGRTGFLVTPGDAGALAEKVIEAWASPDLPRIGEAARARASEFSPEKRVSELVAYLEGLVASKGR